MEYWLLDYGTCPSSGGWHSDRQTDTTGAVHLNCWRNSNATEASPVAPGNLQNIRLIASANDSDHNDTVTIVNGGSVSSAAAADSLFTLADSWDQAEFNIFGYGQL